MMEQGANNSYPNTGPGPLGTPIPNENLLFGAGMVPGLGTDSLDDSSIDGGPGPYTPGAGEPDPQVAGAPPAPDGSGNVLDGFVLEVSDFGIGDVLSLNWALLRADGFFDGGEGGEGGPPVKKIRPSASI